MEDVESQYPDCFKDYEYGVSGGKCPECGSDEYEGLGGENSDGASEFRCLGCGLVYVMSEGEL